jgi:hypothetical protein
MLAKQRMLQAQLPLVAPSPECWSRPYRRPESLND